MKAVFTSAGKDEVTIIDHFNEGLVKDKALDSFNTMKLLKSGGFIKCVVCVKIYDDEGNFLEQYGSI